MKEKRLRRGHYSDKVGAHSFFRAGGDSEPMRLLTGLVSERSLGVAGDNLVHVVPLIIQRTGLPGIFKGTLNIKLAEPFIVHPDAVIAEHEYNEIEFIKLQRCIIGGIRAVIMRPNRHEWPEAWGQDPPHIELVAAYNLRTELSLETNSPVSIEIDVDSARWNSAR